LQPPQIKTSLAEGGRRAVSRQQTAFAGCKPVEKMKKYPKKINRGHKGQGEVRIGWLR